ncbi:MAG: LuxR C-terminal-related transcriptional regulator [Tannerellaceae bacterium]
MGLQFKPFDELLTNEVYHDVNPVAFKQTVHDLIRHASVYSKATNEAFMIASTLKGEVYYISDDLIALTGYTAQELSNIGYQFIKELMTPKENQLMKQMSYQTYEEIFKLRRKDTSSYHIALYKFRIKHKLGHWVTLESRAYPVCHLNNRFMFVVCYIHDIPLYTRPELEIFYINEKIRYIYNHSQKKFIKSEKIQLNSIEHQILKLTATGHKEYQIEKEMQLDINNIKYYKKKIMQKMSVSSMPEAIYLALKNELL